MSGNPQPTQPIDVAIVGGGPAGSLLARTLANRGREVLLIHRQGPRHGVPEETMVPGARALLERAEVLEVIDRHRMFGTKRHASIWGSDALVDRAADDDPGFKIVRSTFDPELRTLAEQAGATVWSSASPVGQWVGSTTPIEHAGSVIDVTARVWVFATGRSTSARHVEVHVDSDLAATLALSVTVPRHVFEGEADAGDVTVVEGVREGWIWWLSLQSGDAHVSLICDREEVRECGRGQVWRSALEAAHGPARLIDRDRSSTAGTIATPRFQYTSKPLFLIGDATSSLDPLSSQGLEKSLSSAERAAYAIETVLSNSAPLETMLSAQADWERGLFRAHEEQTARYYASENRFADAPFWRARQRSFDAAPELPTRFEIDAAVEPATSWQPQGRQLVATPAHRSPSGDLLSRIGPVRLDNVLRLIEHPSSFEEVVTRAAGDPELFPLRRSQLESILRTLLERGFVRSSQK